MSRRYPNRTAVYYAGKAAGLTFALRLLATLDEPIAAGQITAIRTMHGVVRVALARQHDLDLQRAGHDGGEDR